MKTVFKTIFVAAFVMVAAYGVYASQQKVGMSDLAMANVEALAYGETSVQDCKYDPMESCILLHPTDPSLDQERQNARW